MPNISIRYEGKRHCGVRKRGGIYLVGGKLSSPCCKMPYPLSFCPCCNQGIKPSRGFTWISTKIFMDDLCYGQPNCIMNEPDTKVGLMWIGTKFYQTADDFIREANAMGVSKRISQIPKDIKIGETWVMLAHRAAISEIEGTEIKFKAGIFRAFMPERIEYVVKGNETTKELEALEKRGLTLVDVRPEEDAQTSIPSYEQVYIHPINH